jgi:hypothetical protein
MVDTIHDMVHGLGFRCLCSMEKKTENGAK